MTAPSQQRDRYDVSDLSVDVLDLTADGLAVGTMTAQVAETAEVGQRRLQLTVARTGSQTRTMASTCGGGLVGCGTMPKPIGCCCS